jgi:protein SCO1/2
MNRVRTALATALFALTCTNAGSAPLALPPAPQAQFTQNLGTLLPLQQRFTDDDGTSVQLGDVLDRHSALLLFGYYRCPMLCGVVGEGMLEALTRTQLPDDAVRVVEIGIDPHETSADAAQKKADYARRFGSSGRRMHLLTGAPAAIDALAAAAGFQYSYDAAHAQYVHPAGFLIVTPRGRISRYFFGARFDAQELKSAIGQAAEDRVGSALEQLLLLCAHYDPSSGRYSVAVMTVVRVVCIGVCAFLSVWIWRRRRARNNGI